MNAVIPCGGFQYNADEFYFSHDKQGKPIIKKKPILEKVTDFLYEVIYENYDYEDGFQYGETFRYSPVCSAVRKGKYIGRNLDWYYSNDAEIVVKTKPHNGRHGTIGVSHSAISNEQCESGDYEKYCDILPFMMSDCLNDVGVYASMNVVYAEDKGLTTGTNPGKQDLCQLMIPRYVCDFANSAKEAIGLLNECNIYSPKSINEECHILLCDNDDTYIIEFVDNEMVVLSSTDDEYEDIPNNENIITNFYLSGWNGDIKAVYSGATKEEVDATGLTPHAMGLERYEIIDGAYTNLTDKENFISLMEDLKYTNMYNESQNPFWYSEFVDGKLTIYSEDNDFTSIVNQAIDLFEHRTRDVENTWFTAHTSIYDIENKKLSVFVEEDYLHKYEFKLSIPGVLD